MNQFKRLLDALSNRQRLTMVVMIIGVAAAIMGLTHWKRETDFHPLYSALSAEDAGAIVQKLKETGTEYRLSENGTSILAPSARVAELRLEMAALGRPKTGRIGFELFDKTNFGA